MKREAMGHSKIRRLCRTLEVPTYSSVGILECLWHLTARECPRGDIGKLEDSDIADQLGWTGDPALLVAALVDARWLDRSDEHRLIVHDWPQHAEDSVHVRLAKAGELFADGSIPKVNKLSHSERGDILSALEHKSAQKRSHAHKSAPMRIKAPALPCLALPSLAMPSHERVCADEHEPPPKEPEPDVPSAGEIERVVQAMKANHAKKARLGGPLLEQAICGKLQSAVNPRAALEAIENRHRIACECEWRAQEARFWPDLVKWVEEDRWLDPSPQSASAMAIAACGGCGGTGSSLPNDFKPPETVRNGKDLADYAEAWEKLHGRKLETVVCGKCGGSGKSP